MKIQAKKSSYLFFNRRKLEKQETSLYTRVRVGFITIISLCILASGAVFGQKKETTVQLSFLKKADQSKNALIRVVARNEEKKFMPAPNAHVNVYVKDNDAQTLLKSVVTDNAGKATVELPKDLPLDGNHFFNITAKVENDNVYQDAEDNMHYKEANLTIRLNAKDTAHGVTAVITEAMADGKDSVLKDVPVTFYVQRLFGVMAAGSDNTVNTNEKGEAYYAYPKNIPGGETGMLTVVARIDDNDTFGNVQSNATAPWGTIVPVDPNPFPRAMWEPNAPAPLIIFFVVIFGGVWSIYFFIIFQLGKVNNEKKGIAQPNL